MTLLYRWLHKYILSGMIELLFPSCCMLCGSKMKNMQLQICLKCQFYFKRDPLFILSEQNIFHGFLLPSKVLFKWSCWKFQKDGSLQDVMHAIKYQGQYNLAVELGSKAAFKLKKDLEKESIVIDREKTWLVPVPLHPRKFRMRGYNQAEGVAQGFSRILNIPLCPEDWLQRTRFTQTQTGLSLEERKENLAKAFVLTEADTKQLKTLILIDDVFTTGATTYEMAQVLKTHLKNVQIAIITLAQA